MGLKAVKIKFTNKPKEFWSNVKRIDPNGEEEAEEIFGEAEPQYMELDGVISREKGNVSIVFDNGPLLGVRESKMVFSFSVAQPNSVIMVKTAMGNGAYVFDDRQRRNICSFNMGPFPLEFIVCTEDILNTVTYERGGTLTVDYTVEINGVPADGSKMTLKVEPVRY